MSHLVALTDRARAEMEAAYLWWAENRSRSQAVNWYNAFCDAIESLSIDPDHRPLSQENSRFAYEIRDLHFGIGRRPTHRAVFSIRGNLVLVFAIRHLAQQDLSPDDMEQE